MLATAIARIEGEASVTGGLQQWHADFFTVQDREMQLYRARALQLASVHNNTLGN